MKKKPTKDKQAGFTQNILLVAFHTDLTCADPLDPYGLYRILRQTKNKKKKKKNSGIRTITNYAIYFRINVTKVNVFESLAMIIGFIHQL